MNALAAELIARLAVADVAAFVVMLPLSIIGSVLALEGLERFDLSMRRKVEKRLLAPTSDEKA
jgi:hypothetical protein